MLALKECPPLGRVVIVLTVSSALILICRQNGGTDILSGHNSVRWAIPALRVSGAQIRGWRKALLEYLTKAKLLVPVHAIFESEPSVSQTRTLRLYHVHTGESLVVTYKQNGRYMPSAMAQ